MSIVSEAKEEFNYWAKREQERRENIFREKIVDKKDPKQANYCIGIMTEVSWEKLREWEYYKLPKT